MTIFPKFDSRIAVGLGVLALMFVPVISSADYVSNFVGTSCMVPVFNTNFVFPPEGGQIVQIDGQKYFWKSYIPACANAVQQQASTYFGANTPSAYTQPVYTQPVYNQPIYTQPVYNQPVYTQPVQTVPQPQPHTVCSTQYY